MHDFKYEALVRGGAREEAALTGLRSSSPLRPACVAFANNLLRTSSFAFMPAQVAFRVRRDQKWTDFSIFRATGKITSALPEVVSKTTFKKQQREFAKLKKQFQATPLNKQKELAGRLGVDYINKLLEISYGMNQSMEAILSSVVIESWIAFEVLASDVWVAAVDNGPKEFAQRLAISTKLQKPDEQLSHQALRDLEYDPRKEYGASLREVGKVSFQKLDRIMRFYAITFENGVEKLFDKVAEGYIHALSAYRNALIHNAGKADKKFVKRVQRFPELRKIKLNDALLLDGELVKKLRNAAILLGSRLALFVEQLLVSSKP